MHNRIGKEKFSGGESIKEMLFLHTVGDVEEIIGWILGYSFPEAK